jgi:hypothetical protein
VPVWLEPQPLAPDVDQDLSDDERASIHGAHQNL